MGLPLPSHLSLCQWERAPLTKRQREGFPCFFQGGGTPVRTDPGGLHGVGWGAAVCTSRLALGRWEGLALLGAAARAPHKRLSPQPLTTVMAPCSRRSTSSWLWPRLLRTLEPT